ncbi:MAG: hypothetical protein AB1714_13815 [Acidobacteriota bacterium]
MALKDKTLDKDFEPDESLVMELRSRLRDGRLPCVAAFAAAEAMRVEPLLIGKTADAVDLHLTQCQLGLFGYPGHSRLWDDKGYLEPQLPEGVEEAIRAASAEAGRLSCRAAWEIADRFKVARADIGRAADRLGIRLRECQLGAF